MEPADPGQLQQKLGQQKALLESQQQQLLAVMQCVQTTTHQLSTAVQATHLTPAAWTLPAPAPADYGSASAPPAPQQEIREPRLPPPERYNGSPGECRAFLTQCELIFSLQPQTFPTDAARVAYIITQLTGKAKKWGTVQWGANLPCVQSSRLFMQEMHRVFDRSSPGLEAVRDLMRLQQGRSSVSDYAIDFQTLATDSGWEGRALIDAFLHGLSEAVKDELLTQDLPDELDHIIALAIRVDARLEDLRRLVKPRSPLRYYNRRQPTFPSTNQRATFLPIPPNNPVGEPEVMMVDRSRLTKEERERRVRDRACLYCGGRGHFASKCLVKGNAH